MIQVIIIWRLAVKVSTEGIVDYFDDPESFRPERYLESQYGTKPGVDTSDFRNNILFGAGRVCSPNVTMLYHKG